MSEYILFLTAHQHN